MLDVREVVRTGEVALARTVCDGGAAGPELNDAWEVVFVRRGAFRREIDEGIALVDVTTMYVGRPGQPQVIHHLDGAGDAGGFLALSPAIAEPVAERLPHLPVTTSPATLLALRSLAAAGARAGDDLAVDERACAFVERLVADHPLATRDHPAGHRRRAVDRVLERLAVEVDAGDPPASLVSLAADVGYTPHHLARLFRILTGTTIGRHRRALRTRAALARIEGGADDLAAVAAAVGFADHSHLVRAVRAEFGTTPTGLRRLVGRSPA